jgi:hypothetical protein
MEIAWDSERATPYGVEMATAFPPPCTTASTLDGAIAVMEQIDRSLPARDGLACFNRMYLGVTRQVSARIEQGFFYDSEFMSSLEVVYANFYFDAVNAAMTTPDAVPTAWRPLFDTRARGDVYSIQYALAGMNAHINHDLPMALVRTCAQLSTAPESGTNHRDYHRVDVLLDAAELSVRHTFEVREVEKADRSVQTVIDLVDNWSITSARTMAWSTGLALWRCRGDTTVEDLIMSSLASTVSLSSRCLLTAPEREVQIPITAPCERLRKSVGALIHG